MQNRKRPVGIVRFATPDNRKPHTQVKTHRLRILFIDIDRISSLAGDGPTPPTCVRSLCPGIRAERTTWRYDFRSDR